MTGISQREAKCGPQLPGTGPSARPLSGSGPLQGVRTALTCCESNPLRPATPTEPPKCGLRERTPRAALSPPARGPSRRAFPRTSSPRPPDFRSGLRGVPRASARTAAARVAHVGVLGAGWWPAGRPAGRAPSPEHGAGRAPAGGGGGAQGRRRRAPAARGR